MPGRGGMSWNRASRPQEPDQVSLNAMSMRRVALRDVTGTL
jgi:hypothetical protein